MEKSKMQKLREEVRKVRNDREKREKLCGEFYADLDESTAQEGRCSVCGKPFKRGDRIFHFQGFGFTYCDHCFCDAIEVEIYTSYGLNFEDEYGGGTIWVDVEGEEEVLISR